jgi:hypothetical protein
MKQPKLPNDVIKFIIKFIIFILPALFIFLVFDIIAIKSGELRTIDYIIKRQKIESGLYGRGVADQDLRKYKFKNFVNRESADVVTVGSSRVLEFRDYMFAPIYSFYNLGSIAHGIGDIQDLLNNWPEHQKPKLVILALDYHWFSDSTENIKGISQDMLKKDAAYDFGSHVMSVRFLIKKLLTDYKYLLSVSGYNSSNQYSSNRFGFQAKFGNGVRNDGSYQYGSYIKISKKNEHIPYIDREQPPIIDRVRNGIDQYKFNSKIDNSRIETLNAILKRFKDKDIYVVGLMMPFSPEVYTELTKNPKHTYLFLDVRKNMKDVFKKNQYTFFDFSDPMTVNLSDAYFFDGLHVSEPGVLRILIKLLQNLSDSKIENKDTLISNLNKVIKTEELSSWEIDH